MKKLSLIFILAISSSSIFADVYKLVWDANTDSTTGYKIYESVDGIAWIHTGGTIGKTNTSWTVIPTLTTTYRRVTATNDIGLESDPSNIVPVQLLVKPTKPQNIKVTIVLTIP